MTKDKFNKNAVHPLQSWEWGEFREAWGNRVVRLDDCQIIFSKVPYTGFTIGTVIRGPKPNRESVQEIKKVAKENGAILVKFEPNVLSDEKLASQLLSMGFVGGRRLFTPTSFWIDLTLSEEELLKSFSGKTRYNIRLAEKRGVKVAEDNSDKAFAKYLSLTKETSQRQGFYAHTEKYHKLMWKLLKPAGIAHLMVAKYKGEIITAWILFTWHDFLYYPYGASTEKHKEVMANNLIMWEAIKFGKENNLKTFDLWGREEGKGFTRFKEGYNPKVIEFIGTWDLPTSVLYWPYRIAEEMRWRLLRLITIFKRPSF
ncbi:MAG: FemAB family protein [Candidatus Woesebacteria bacterium GW2011_GWB1_45_5]|uniref:FemAB family protein n=1 Tax=Candidatus Woesebacteria bacterium GW2011_GWB1_45_5 TaxID=1618581 RepID=A0A0G1MP62_9BACT|nr:MAG: FemAB family protein [Candidatus Woesebacteria bacterium GW2011_GWB1_45_5]